MVRLLTSERLLDALRHTWAMRLLLLLVSELAGGARSARGGAWTRRFVATLMVVRLVAGERLLNLLHRAGLVLAFVARRSGAVALLLLAAVPSERFLDLLHRASSE